MESLPANSAHEEVEVEVEVEVKVEVEVLVEVEVHNSTVKFKNKTCIQKRS